MTHESRAPRPQGIGNRAVSSIIWTAAQKWAVRITGFVTIALLTRTLAPADFGTVAVATAVLPLCYLLADMGFSTYIVQVSQLSSKTLSTAFWFSSAAGVVLTGALALSAPLIASMFRVPDSVPVIWGIALAIIFVTFSTVPTAIMKRQMKFKRLAAQSLTASVMGQGVAVLLALLNFGVWALVAQTVLYQFVFALLVWIGARWRPTVSFSRREFRTMASFGAKVVGVDLIAAIRTWAENAILVAALGVSGLGYVNVAQRLVAVAQDVTAAAVMPVSTVVFAQVREDAARLRSGYLRGLGICCAVIVPVMVFFAAAAPDLVPLLFGDQWGPSIVPSQLLAVAGIFTLGAALDHALFYGVGRPGTWLFYGAAIDSLTVVAAFLSAPFGPVAWATSFLGVAVMATIIRWPLVGSLTETPWQTIGSIFVRAGLTGALAAGAGFAASGATSGQSNWVSVLAIGMSVVIAYFVAMQLFMRDESREMIRLLRTNIPIPRNRVQVRSTQA